MPAKPGPFSDRLPTLLSTSRQEGFGSPPLYPPQKDVAPCLTRADRRGQKFWTGATVLGEGPCKKSRMPAPSAFATETALVAGEGGGLQATQQLDSDNRTRCLHLPGALRAEGLSSLPSSLLPPPPCCWLAVGPVHPSGSELLGTDPRCAPRSRVSSSRMCCCCGYCACVPSCPILVRPSV